MAEDMTYTPVQTLADARQRIAELERENAALTREVAGLRYYIAQLERNVTAEERAYAAGVASLLLSEQTTPQDADDTDAPLTLAAIEDGDE